MADLSLNQDSLTLEETNNVRVSLGLKPIGAAPAEGEEVVPDQESIAEANFAERKQEERKAREEKEIKERIEKYVLWSFSGVHQLMRSRAKNQRALNAKLKGSTLGSATQDDALDTKSWAKKLAKRAKQREQELAAKRQKEMEEADQAVYDERDLTGLKVTHGTDEFESGEDVVLTLKDSKVLEGDGESRNLTCRRRADQESEDELQNVNMMEDERLKEARERKRKAQAQYTGYDDGEFDENRIGQRADVLGKYDDEYSGGKARSEGFRLGAVETERKPLVKDEDEEMLGGAPATKIKLNLDYAKDFDIDDYAKEGEAGFKKPKKKKAKRSARRAEDEEDTAGAMELDGPPSFSKRVVEDTPQNLVDDDDLQAALARSRREQARRKPKVKLEDLAAQIAEQRQAEPEQAQDEDRGEEDGRITFDDTSEFVRNVSLESRLPVKREPAASPPPEASTSRVNGSNGHAEPVVVKVERVEIGEADEDEDMDSEDEDEALAEMAAREGLSLDEYRLKIDQQLREMDSIQAEDAQDPTETEPVVGNGVSGILDLLRKQGALQKRTVEDEEREKVQKAKDLWLADHRRRLAQRELEKVQARGGNKDEAQRQYDNRMREQREAREALQDYKDYKPDINIVYHDEFGRNMTPKEAWKSLSHKFQYVVPFSSSIALIVFSGKTSGRMKTEKRMKKIAEEQKQLKMLSGDTPTGMTDAFARRQQKTGQAHMVLSTGNKQSVPMAEKKVKDRR